MSKTAERTRPTRNVLRYTQISAGLRSPAVVKQAIHRALVELEEAITFLGHDDPDQGTRQAFNEDGWDSLSRVQGRLQLLLEGDGRAAIL